MAAKVGDLEFPDFSAQDRAMIIEAMNSMKESPGRGHPAGSEQPEETDVKRAESAEQSGAKMIGSVGNM